MSTQISSGNICFQHFKKKAISAPTGYCIPRIRTGPISHRETKRDQAILHHDHHHNPFRTVLTAHLIFCKCSPFVINRSREQPTVRKPSDSGGIGMESAINLRFKPAFVGTDSCLPGYTLVLKGLRCIFCVKASSHIPPKMYPIHSRAHITCTKSVCSHQCGHVHAHTHTRTSRVRIRHRRCGVCRPRPSSSVSYCRR